MIIWKRNDIVIYKSKDGLVKMEAMVEPVNETIWANQKAIAALFDCTKQNVSDHMGKDICERRIGAFYGCQRNFDYRTEWRQRHI